MEIIIIKRHGEEEEYDERKVYASVYAAALICQHGEKKAENTAKEIARAITLWIRQQAKKIKGKKGSITSADIREQVIKYFKDKEVRTIYTHYRDLC